MNIRGYTPSANISVKGFIETSFVDWDGKVAAVIFLPYCNFRCPFCSNGPLITEPEKLAEIPLEKIEDFIRQRRDFLDGVVISGGEPTIHPWLPQLIDRFKQLGLLIKLDTNGASPDFLATHLPKHLIDFVAMDSKAPLNDKYQLLAGTKIDLEKIKASIRLIMASGVDYEFRTTVVPTLLDETDIEAIAQTLAGARKLALQQFVPGHALDEKLHSVAPFSKEQFADMARAARSHIPNTIVRG